MDREELFAQIKRYEALDAAGKALISNEGIPAFEALEQAERYAIQVLAPAYVHDVLGLPRDLERIPELLFPSVRWKGLVHVGVQRSLEARLGLSYDENGRETMPDPEAQPIAYAVWCRVRNIAAACAAAYRKQLRTRFKRPRAKRSKVHTMAVRALTLALKEARCTYGDLPTLTPLQNLQVRAEAITYLSSMWYRGSTGQAYVDENHEAIAKDIYVRCKATKQFKAEYAYLRSLPEDATYGQVMASLCSMNGIELPTDLQVFCAPTPAQ